MTADELGRAGRPLTAEESERLARYVAGEMESGERMRIEQEILDDPALANALYSDANLRASIAAVDDVTRARMERESMRRGGARWLRIALPAAAVLLLVVVLPRFFPGDGTGQRRLRSPSVVPAPAPASSVEALFPAGSLDEPPPRFVWTNAPGATTYRLEVTDESGAVVFSAVTAETTLVFPAELAGRSGSDLSWRVVPADGSADREPSNSLRFRVGR